MSTPLQADLSSVVEKGANVAETRYRKFSGSTNSGIGYLGGEERGLCELMPFVKKRGEARKKYREKRQTDLFTRTFMFEDVKKR